LIKVQTIKTKKILQINLIEKIREIEYFERKAFGVFEFQFSYWMILFALFLLVDHENEFPLKKRFDLVAS
jgi:hypothetical protein